MAWMENRFGEFLILCSPLYQAGIHTVYLQISQLVWTLSHACSTMSAVNSDICPCLPNRRTLETQLSPAASCITYYFPVFYFHFLVKFYRCRHCYYCVMQSMLIQLYPPICCYYWCLQKNRKRSYFSFAHGRTFRISFNAVYRFPWLLFF